MQVWLATSVRPANAPRSFSVTASGSSRAARALAVRPKDDHAGAVRPLPGKRVCSGSILPTLRQVAQNASLRECVAALCPDTAWVHVAIAIASGSLDLCGQCAA